LSDELYQTALLKLAKDAPRKGRLDPNDASVRLDNPLCGDRVRIDLRRDGEAIAELAHEVRGCVLCQAAAGVIATHAIGMDRAGVARLCEAADRALAGEETEIAELASFKPVVPLKSRHDCVRLPFQALKQAVEA
jgi:nitrogen fixation NifU-like protein